ncbi:hypothetical protein BURMUCGD1_4489 [Burkholderia multivorans CGD1]|nr:hypothetical protein BURMUCGD1_4489 [Burkholderia multivorans CGD1]
MHAIDAGRRIARETDGSASFAPANRRACPPIIRVPVTAA